MAKIYVTSDIEGRYDLYLQFLINIGAIDTSKLTKDQMKVLNNRQGPFFFSEQERRILLSIDVGKCLNPNFQGKILFNGDFITDRPMMTNGRDQLAMNDHMKMKLILNKTAFNKYSVDLAKKCFEMFKALRKQYHNNLILVAGNHDIYDMENDAKLRFDLHLNAIKKDVMKLGFKRYYHVKLSNGQHLIFKHAPWASEKQLQEMLNDENADFNNHGFLVYNGIHDNSKPNINELTEDRFFWMTEAHDGTINTPNALSVVNNNLKKRNCFLIHGHSHNGDYNNKKNNKICVDYSIHTPGVPKNYFVVDDWNGKIEAKDFYTNQIQFVTNEQKDIPPYKPANPTPSPFMPKYFATQNILNEDRSKKNEEVKTFRKDDIVLPSWLNDDAEKRQNDIPKKDIKYIPKQNDLLINQPPVVDNPTMQPNEKMQPDNSIQTNSNAVDSSANNIQTVQANVNNINNERRVNKTDDNADHIAEEPRPEIEWWMILLCLILIGLFFIIKTKYEQGKWDEEHKQRMDQISNKNNVKTSLTNVPRQTRYI